MKITTQSRSDPVGNFRIILRQKKARIRIGSPLLRYTVPTCLGLVIITILPVPVFIVCFIFTNRQNPVRAIRNFLTTCIEIDPDPLLNIWVPNLTNFNPIIWTMNEVTVISMNFYSSISLSGSGLRIRIRIQRGNLNPDPTGSGSETLVRSNYGTVPYLLDSDAVRLILVHEFLPIKSATLIHT